MKPEVPRNAIISNPSERYRSGDKVTFECKEGFNQEGIATQMCFQGQWTVLPFKCSGKLPTLIYYIILIIVLMKTGPKQQLLGRTFFRG